MRPAQHALARALRPPKQPRLHMRQATVIAGFGGVPAASPLYSDSFARPDVTADTLGQTDGGTGGRLSWQGTPVAAIHANTATLFSPATPDIADETAAYQLVNVGRLGGMHRVTLARLNDPTGATELRAYGLVFRAISGTFSGTTNPLTGINQPGGVEYGGVNSCFFGEMLSGGGTYNVPTGDPQHPITQGDTISVIDTVSQLDFYVNGTLIYSTPTSPAVASGTWAGLFAIGQIQPDFGLWLTLPGFTNWSFSPLTTGDVVVDFGDGVHVACARHAGCSPLVVGDQVRVDRQGHSNLVVDKIIALGG